MPRALDHLGGAAELDDLPKVHDGDAVGDVLHHRKVVRDKNEAEIHPADELREQIQDLGLDGDVEGGDGLISDDNPGLQGEGAGHGNALALAPGELMRVFLHEARSEADDLHELGDASGHLVAGADLVNKHGLGERGKDCQARIERAVGILEDHLQSPTRCPHLRRTGGGEVPALEHNAASGGGQELQDGPRQRRLAAARFADQPQHLAAPHGKADAIDRLHGARLSFEDEAAVHREVRLEVLQLEDRFRHVNFTGARRVRGGRH